MMRRPSVDSVAAAMVAEGTLSPDAAARLGGAARAQLGASTPWFVRVLVGFGAWVAAMLFATVFTMLGLLEDEVAGGALAGVTAIVVTAVRPRARGEFVTQLLLALSIGSHALLVGLAGDASDSVMGGAAFAIAIEAAALVLFRDPVRRFLAAAAIVVAALVLVTTSESGLDAGGVAAALVLLAAAAAALALAVAPSRFDAGRLGEARGPALYGLTLAVLGTLVVPRAESDALALAPEVLTWGFALGLVALGLAAARVRSLEPVVAVAVAALLLALVSAPGPLAALFVVGLAFHRREPVLAGLAAVFLVAFTALFYYDLEVTLLAKSGILVGTGLAALAAYGYVYRRSSDHGGQS